MLRLWDFSSSFPLPLRPALAGPGTGIRDTGEGGPHLASHSNMYLS